MILHITNDYSGSTVYKNLIHELDQLGFRQIVYNPVREKSRIGKNEIEFSVKDSKIVYSHILDKYLDRIFYKKKIKKIISDIESKINFDEVSMIHAHTWFSDGGVAYILSKKYNIPYIVAVRNTDLNIFWKYLFFHHRFGAKVLVKASYIISISHVYSQRIKEICKTKNITCSQKLIQVPNGVDSFWLTNIRSESKIKRNKTLNIIYVGKFNSGKNIKKLSEAVKELFDQEEKIHLTLVGGGGNQHNEIIQMVNKNPLCFAFKGIIRDKNELISLYRESDIFAMPSLRETFGLVYIEAMTQGLPVLYSKNEGIDGMYHRVGEAVDPSSKKDIIRGIKRILDLYETYEIPTQEIIQNHDWKAIALKYKLLYENTINTSIF